MLSQVWIPSGTVVWRPRQHQVKDEKKDKNNIFLCGEIKTLSIKELIRNPPSCVYHNFLIETPDLYFEFLGDAVYGISYSKYVRF